MKFLLDENIPIFVVDIIMQLGFEVEHVRKIGLRGATDKEIAEYARNKKAILVTKDIEFGSLILYHKNSHYGLLLLRLPHYYNAKQIAEVIKKFLIKTKPEILVNSIVVLEIGRYRRRILE